jgi:hypothetical protein
MPITRQETTQPGKVGSSNITIKKSNLPVGGNYLTDVSMEVQPLSGYMLNSIFGRMVVTVVVIPYSQQDSILWSRIESGLTIKTTLSGEVSVYVPGSNLWYTTVNTKLRLNEENIIYVERTSSGIFSISVNGISGYKSNITSTLYGSGGNKHMIGSNTSSVPFNGIIKSIAVDL